MHTTPYRKSGIFTRPQGPPPFAHPRFSTRCASPRVGRTPSPPPAERDGREVGRTGGDVACVCVRLCHAWAWVMQIPYVSLAVVQLDT